MTEARIIYEPPDRHQCIVFLDDHRSLGVVRNDYPAYWARPGTVLECDCGQTFVAQPWLPGECFARWRREGRIARWRRQRRQGRSPVVVLPTVTASPDRLPPSAAVDADPTARSEAEHSCQPPPVYECTILSEDSASRRYTLRIPQGTVWACPCGERFTVKPASYLPDWLNWHSGDLELPGGSTVVATDIEAAAGPTTSEEK